MLDKKNKICFSKKEILEIFVTIDYIMVSLAEIGRDYSVPENSNTIDYNTQTTKFIDDNDINTKLAEIRKLINSKLYLSLGDDDMDDLERACLNTEYWKRPR